MCGSAGRGWGCWVGDSGGNCVGGNASVVVLGKWCLGWCDLWYIAGEVWCWVVMSGAGGKGVIKVSWVEVSWVGWDVAFQGPPEPAL